MAKMYLGSKKFADARLQEAFLAVNKYAKKDAKNIAGISLANWNTQNILLVYGSKTVTKNFTLEEDARGVTCYLADILQKDVAALVFVRKEETLETCYHEMCHALSANRKFRGIASYADSKVDIFNEGYTEFLAKYIYEKTTKKKFRFADVTYKKYAMLLDLYLLLFAEGDISRLANIYFASKVKTFAKTLCKDIFSVTYNELAEYLQVYSEREVISSAVQNILEKNICKLQREDILEKVRKLFSAYNVEEANKVLKKYI